MGINQILISDDWELWASEFVPAPKLQLGVHCADVHKMTHYVLGLQPRDSRITFSLQYLATTCRDIFLYSTHIL